MCYIITMKKGIKVNVSSSGEASALKKMSKKELGNAQHGNPDQTDEKWIQIWIKLYERAYPGRLGRMANDVATEVALSSLTKHAVVNETAGMQKAFWLPEDLQQVLEASYPSFWTNQKHIRWFCRHFPQFAFETYTKKIKR